MRNFAMDLALGDCVAFLGSLGHGEVADLYSSATVLGVPSVWPESVGMVGPEPMAHGLPVIACRAGGIPEWLVDEETGLMGETKDVAGLAAKF